MSNVARSGSCQDAGSSKHSLGLNSRDSQRITNEKRSMRVVDRKHVGGAELGSIKDEHQGRGRSRSKSPRRNSWREEIKEIKSWKDERENGEIKFEDIRHGRQHGKRGQASQRSSKGCSRGAKKFDLFSSGSKIIKKDGREVKKESRCRMERKDVKERASPTLVLVRRKERLSKWKQVKKSLNIVNNVEVGLVMRRQDGRENLDRTKVVTTALGTSSKDSADNSDDELELRISDKDIFPELRDEKVDEESAAVPDVVMDDMKDDTSTENVTRLEIKMNHLLGEEASRKRNMRLVDDNDQDVEDEKMAGPARAQPIVIRAPKFSHGSFAVVMGSNIEESSSSTSFASVMSDEDSSAMARNFSLLELKMEVYTTRLKELEWEREQLRKEREEFQDREVLVKRDLVKRVLVKKTLIADVNLCEKENKG